MSGFLPALEVPCVAVDSRRLLQHRCMSGSSGSWLCSASGGGHRLEGGAWCRRIATAGDSWTVKSCCKVSRKSRRAAQRLLSRHAHAAASAGTGDIKSLLPDKPAFKRVMLKLSGEALQGGMGFGVDPKVLETVAKEVAAAHLKGVQVAIVVGGGNYFRGVNAWAGLDRATADYVGMLATCMNAMVLQSALEAQGVPTRVQTAIEMREIAEPYIRRRAVRHLDHGMVVIFGAGTGNPFFTTDTAAALRAAEIDAQAFFKATKVDGVYDQDPEQHPDAKLHKRLSFREVTLQNLRVMDETAITLCKENNIPVVVFNLKTPGNIMRALTGDVSIGTLVSAQEDLSVEQSDVAKIASR